VAAEYEVNIKINTKKVETDLNTIDNKIKNLGKSATSKEKGLERIVDKRARLMNRINEMEAKGLKVAKLRAQMGKATEQQSRRDLGNAQKEYRVLERSIRLEQSKLKILRSQREGFAASPVRGIRSMMGSPAQIAASGRQRVSPISGRIDIAGSPAQMQAIRKLEMAEMRADKNAHFAELKLIQKRQKIQLDNVDKLFRANERELEKFNRKLEAADKARQKRLTGANAGRGQFGPAGPGVQGPRQMIASPIGGATNIPGSPAFLRRQQRIKTLEQVGLGAGFPLLFGGGAGSVIGGGLGGLTGSFGAQIAFSAIGQQIDQFVASMVNAGKALTSVGGAANFMAEKSLFSSDSMQFRIEKLIEEGQVTEAAALMTKEMAKQVGGSGLKALKDLGDEANKMGKLFNALILQVQAFISRALTPLLAAINKVVGDVVLNNQFNALMSEATGARRKEIEKFLEPYTRKIRKGAAAKDVATSEGKRLAVEKFGGQVIPEGAAIEPTGLELLRAGDKGSDKAAKDAERLARRLAGLEAERTKLEQLLQLDQQINTAKLEGDNRQVIALENEARLLQFAEKEAVIRASKVPQEQKIAELRNLGLERDRALLENAFKLDSFDKQKTDDLKLQLEQLDLQLEAATAVTREAENQAKLELLLLNLRESNKNLTEDQQNQLEELMDKTRKLFEAQNQGPLQSFITNSVKSLNDLEQHAVQVSQGIGNAIGNSLVNGMQNLVTGAQSVKEVFADMLKSIADVLAQQAAQMIATYIAIGIARAFAGMGSSDGASSVDMQTMGVPTAQANTIASGGSVGWSTDMPLNAGVTNPKGFNFAAGGYVSGPTRALIGEGGQGEYVIPENKMRESMARYSRGARGSSVIPEAGGSGTSGEGGGTAVAAPIDVRYTVERINSVDYVTADQFQTGMRQAANQGAKQGEQQTLKRLQMSSSTRKRVGM
jgi:hypothetical protein